MNRREAQAEATSLGAQAHAILRELEWELSQGGALEAWLDRAGCRDASARQPLDEDLVSAAHKCWRVLKLNEGGRVVKPVEVVKVALHGHSEALHVLRERMQGDVAGMPTLPQVLSERTIDRLIFNRNYWRDAYWSRIVDVAGTDAAPDLLNAMLPSRVPTTLAMTRSSCKRTWRTFERSCAPGSMRWERPMCLVNPSGAKGTSQSCCQSSMSDGGL